MTHAWPRLRDIPLHQTLTAKFLTFFIFLQIEKGRNFDNVHFQIP